jgi:cold shock CspA family protein
VKLLGTSLRVCEYSRHEKFSAPEQWPCYPSTRSRPRPTGHGLLRWVSHNNVKESQQPYRKHILFSVTMMSSVDNIATDAVRDPAEADKEPTGAQSIPASSLSGSDGDNREIQPSRDNDGGHVQQLKQSIDAPRVKGRVKWFNYHKGFGFITVDNETDEVFVHQSNINSDGFRSLREDEEVEFDLMIGEDGKKKAFNVTGPDGQPPQGAILGGPAQHGPAKSHGGVPRMVAHDINGMNSMTPISPTAAMGQPYPGAAVAQVNIAAGQQGQQYYGQMAPMAFYQHAGYYQLNENGYPYPMPPVHQGGYVGYGGRGWYGSPRPPPPGTPGFSSGLQVVVHNLPWDCSWQELRAAFEDIGQIERADVVFDSQGRSRGFGVVRFTEKESALLAVEKMNDKKISGRVVSVRVDRFA